jgi:hypothetical protein
MRWWCWVWVLAVGAAVAQAADEPAPPIFPATHKILSTSVQRWHIAVFGTLFVEDRGVRRIMNYVRDLPGMMKARVYKLHGKPFPPGPEEIHAYYTDWAKQAGYHPLVEVRLGNPPPDPMFDDRDRPHRRPERNPGPRSPRDLEVYTWVDAFYRPGDDGGVFITVWTENKLIYLWKPGHTPVGPVLGEWLGFPAAPVDASPPKTVDPWPDNPSPPDTGPGGFFVRAKLRRWEIESVTRDMEARVKEGGEPHGPIEAIFSVGSQLFAPVRHAWVWSFRPTPEEAATVADPWIRWAVAQDWKPLATGGWAEMPTRIWYKAGADGGALVLFRVKDTLQVLVFDGGPNLLALLPVMDHLTGPRAGP